MKPSQNDLIMMIVGFVVCLGAVAVFLFTKPEPTAPATPAEVNVTDPVLAPGNVVTGSSLPGGGSGAGGFAGGGGGFGGAPASAFGPGGNAGGFGGGGGQNENVPTFAGTQSN